jgi:hypothetical protein
MFAQHTSQFFNFTRGRHISINELRTYSLRVINLVQKKRVFLLLTICAQNASNGCHYRCDVMRMRMNPYKWHFSSFLIIIFFVIIKTWNATRIIKHKSRQTKLFFFFFIAIVWTFFGEIFNGFMACDPSSKFFIRFTKRAAP